MVPPSPSVPPWSAATAVDDWGNEDEGSFTVTVVDTMDPELTVP
jgi:hypothetical protein